MSLLAVTVDVDMRTILIVCGGAAIMASMLGVLNANMSKWAGVAGVGLLVAGFLLVSGGAQPTPVPPGPTPPPTPVPTPFADNVAASFKSEGCTHEEALILASMYAQMADALLFNASQDEQIKTTNGLGKAFARLQRHRFLAETTPMSQRFPRTELLISAEMGARKLKEPGELDDAERVSAAQLFDEVANGLLQIE